MEENNSENTEKQEKIEEKDKETNEVVEETADEKEEKKDTSEKVLHTTEEFDELNDRYKRIFAEFENYKKRSQKERETLYNSILGDIVTAMLPILDNLENAVKAECQDESYKQGVELVEKQFKEFLQKHNVEEIEAEGKRFDPSVHEAVSHIEDQNKGEQEIVNVCRKGYRIGGKVIRHSMVMVAN